MRSRFTLMALIAAQIFTAQPVNAQLQCDNLTQQLITTYRAAYPCPGTALELQTYQKRFKGQLVPLREGLKALNKSVKGSVNIQTVISALNQHFIQRRDGLEGL